MMNEWRPISEAPRDGSWIIAYDANTLFYVPVFAYWCIKKGGWRGVDMNLIVSLSTNDKNCFFICCPSFPKPKVMIDAQILLDLIDDDFSYLYSENNEVIASAKSTVLMIMKERIESLIEGSKINENLGSI